jgi:putative holliday junction resolvase
VSQDYWRIIAFDIGDVWIGVAHTDLTRTLVFSHDIWKIKDFYEKFDEYMSRNRIKLIVIGLPITMKGESSDQTKKVCDFKKKLAAKINIQICFQDERLSSKFARNIIKSQFQDSKKKDHAVSAAVILENFLTVFRRS